MPVILQPILISPITTAPPTSQNDNQPVTLPPIALLPTDTRSPNEIPNGKPTNMPLPSSSSISPTLVQNETLTIEEYLTQTITDDGTLQKAGTPQYLALKQLLQTNPDLDPKDVADQIEITQRYALNTFYYATGGSDWKVSTLWTTADPPCNGVSNWVGITCDTDTDANTVTGLVLQDNLIRGTIPSEIRGLNGLRK